MSHHDQEAGISLEGGAKIALGGAIFMSIYTFDLYALALWCIAGLALLFFIGEQKKEV